MWMLKDADLFQYLTAMRSGPIETEYVERQKELWDLIGTGVYKSLVITAGRFALADFQFGVTLIYPGDLQWSAPPAEHQKKTLSHCSSQLWVCSPSRDKYRWCSDGFTPHYLLGFTGSIKTLIIRIQKEHQRMPCNLLPPREQVAPIPLHCLDITPSFHIACWIQAGTLSAGITSAWHLPEWLQPSDNILHPF